MAPPSHRNDELRADFSDLWIFVPLTIMSSLIAVILLLPLIIQRYCGCCAYGGCYGCWQCSETIVSRCGASPRRKIERFTVESKSVQADEPSPINRNQAVELDGCFRGYQLEVQREVKTKRTVEYAV